MRNVDRKSLKSSDAIWSFAVAQDDESQLFKATSAKPRNPHRRGKLLEQARNENWNGMPRAAACRC